MDTIDFVSSSVTSKSREEIKERRENVLEKAERKAKKAQIEKDKASGWMLPEVENALFSSKSPKKSHKEKKLKKEKKSKKKRKKHDSSSSSSESEDEWVEKSYKHKKHKKEKKSKKKRKRRDSSSSKSDSKDDPVEKEVIKLKPKETQRDSWMDFGSSFDSFGDLASGKSSGSKEAKRIEKERADQERIEKLSRRELNPVLRQELIQQSMGFGGDKSLEMLKRAVDRVYAQAKLEGKSVEEIASKRWGNMDKFNEMLGKLKKYEQGSERQEKQPLPIERKEASRMVASKSGWKTSERKEKERSDFQQTKMANKPKEESETKSEKSSNEPTEAEVITIMSDLEMNKLGAKIVKAELMGDLCKARKLKETLENARKAKEASANQPQSTSDNNPSEPETVILTRTDSKGMTRPIQTDVSQSTSRGKKGKVQTLDKDGQRLRYFADDDQYDLKEMFHREKMSTAEDQSAMMSRLAGRAVEKTDDDDYSIDDLFTSRAARKRSEDQDKVKERDAAIAEHKSLTRTLDTCSFCYEGADFKKHLLVAVGKTCYVCLPWHLSLTEGHCFIVPSSHVSCATLLDEDVYAEMQQFRKALCRMFQANGDEDCVFFEVAKGLKRHPHMVIECVPLPREMGDMAPMYFQKGINECESEWSHNQKLVKLTKEKDIRRSVPKGLPYFHVDFGMQNGFAHVIEDEQMFPRNFAQGNFTKVSLIGQKGQSSFYVNICEYELC